MICLFSNERTSRRYDRRVQRTQQLLRAALLSLIDEKGFETLTVQDIIDRANVGRATFYAHFDNKEDLLVSGFDELRIALKELQRRACVQRSDPDEQLFAFTHAAFAHISEYRRVFRTMVGKRCGALVQQLLNKIVLDLVRDDIKAVPYSAALISLSVPSTPTLNTFTSTPRPFGIWSSTGLVTSVRWTVLGLPVKTAIAFMSLLLLNVRFETAVTTKASSISSPCVALRFAASA
jgi:AcrR family transcriptional regulator